jgi:hypothetical protein
MAEQKTRPGKENVVDFLNKIEPEQKRKDSFALLNMMQELTKEEPVLWGGSMVGFGQIHYKYASGHEGDWFKAGFAPRKQNISLYVMSYDKSGYADLLAKLGKHKTGAACLYVNKLSDIDLNILREIIRRTIIQCKQ